MSYSMMCRVLTDWDRGWCGNHAHSLVLAEFGRFPSSLPSEELKWQGS